ncbi:MAG: pilus assembly protein PilP [Myxococcota bacterium]
MSGCFFVTACGDDSASVSSGEPIQTPKKVDAKTATSKDTPEEEPEDRAEFSYSPVGKRDPFRSYLADLTEAQTEVQRRPVQATERFELDQYRLTGLITGTSQPKALVEDPEGIGHTVRIGSYMGRNGGIVTRITSDGIIVTEEFRAPTGELVKVPIAVKLPRPDIEIVGSR